jgi:ribosomal protein S18 acetylase RimI-like enzyme
MNHAQEAAAVSIRPLAAADLDDVVAIDAAIEGRTRRDYVERRLAAARREPALHAQFAAVDARGLAGYILSRVLVGEFGRSRPGVRLELVGVRADLRGAGVGHRLFDALVAWAKRHDMQELRTAASWRDTTMLGWFDAMGFELAGDRIVDCAVDGGAYHAGRDDADDFDEDHGREIDYGRPEANDHERLARDRADVRSMMPADLAAIARIDRGITGHDRGDYIAARLAEAMDDSAIRVSLTARCDDAIVGYLMARADLGDFGRTEPVAVIDTIGVDPDYAHRGIGRALLSQLFANLGALRVERVETVVPPRDLGLLGFLDAGGFRPAQRLAFVRRLEAGQ